VSHLNHIPRLLPMRSSSEGVDSHLPFLHSISPIHLPWATL
jgi:hypothetical protein